MPIFTLRRTVIKIKAKAAVSMALSDIAVLLPWLSLDKLSASSVVIKAIAEQAVFLTRNYEQISEGKVLTGESIEGISESYTLIDGGLTGSFKMSFGLSPRAAAYIEQAKRENGGSTARITRG